MKVRSFIFTMSHPQTKVLDSWQFILRLFNKLLYYWNLIRGVFVWCNYLEKVVYLVMEKMDCNLKNFVQKKRKAKLKLKKSLIKHIFRQIVEGVDYLHNKNIMHRDLKPQNILINLKSVDIKIADFGLARHFQIPYKNMSREICNFLI